MCETSYYKVKEVRRRV